MNVFTVVVAGSIVCSLAYAAHQGRPVSAQPDGAGNRSISYEGLVLGQRPKGHTMAALGGGGECTIGESLNWFTTVHLLPECAELVWGGLYASGSSVTTGRHVAVDVDGDGRDDHLILAGDVIDERSGESYLVRSYSLEYGTSSSFQPRVGTDALFTVNYTTTGDGIALELHSVMRGSVLLEALCAVTKPCDGTVANVTFEPSDFKDLDGDGDLDLILRIVVYDGQSTSIEHRVWIENTVKANPQLAADINQDGVVDGKDLASVLAAWTP